MIELIGLPQSNFVWTCHIAAAEKGVPVIQTIAMAHKPPMDRLHPLGKMPVLRHGPLVIAESRAICGYIDAAFEGPALLPADPAARALVEQWASIVATAVDPLCVRRYLFAYLFPGTADGPPNQAAIAAALPGMATQLDLLEAAVAPTGFLAGPGFSLADAYLVPILFYLGNVPEAAALLAARPALAAYRAAMLARPAIAGTIPPPLPKG